MTTICMLCSNVNVCVTTSNKAVYETECLADGKYYTQCNYRCIWRKLATILISVVERRAPVAAALNWINTSGTLVHRIRTGIYVYTLGRTQTICTGKLDRTDTTLVLCRGVGMRHYYVHYLATVPLCY